MLAVALAQMNIVWENKDENFKRIHEYVKQAKSDKVDIVFFPEMTLTGFSMNIRHTAETKEETIKNVQKLAIQNQIAIGVGWVKSVDELAENHYTIINSKGEIISDYVKMHPFSFGDEDRFFIKGNCLSFFTLKNFTFCNFICYDLRFPEVFQIASKKADAIIIAANWPEQRAEHWKTLLKARAIENQCYILGVNCVGQVGELKYSGDSCIISPEGNILAGTENKEKLVIYKLENDVKNIRSLFPVKNDRRESLYMTKYKENMYDN